MTRSLRSNFVSSLLSAVVITAVTSEPSGQPATPRFLSTLDTVPTGWAGPVFSLSQDYPVSKPAAGAKPWKAFSFRTQSQDYLLAVRDYCFDGNVAADWVLQNNAVRKWYHVPWLHYGPKGREFVRGLTHERTSRPKELAPTQTASAQNWAVGFYNPSGGYTVGQVWKDAVHPNPSAAIFSDGAVTCKLLFTSASVAQVPFLQGSPEWQVNIDVPGSPAGSARPPRSIQTLRLLQMDVAVRDSRAASTTGWVYGTFIYNNAFTGSTPWKHMQPVGLSFGNDPAVTGPGSLVQSIINSDPTLPRQHLGWGGRLNGPVDNPASACQSCHSTAQWPVKSNMTPPAGTTPGSVAWMRWYRNIPVGTGFDPGAVSLGTSLQLALGIQNLSLSKPHAMLGGSRTVVHRVTRDP